MIRIALVALACLVATARADDVATLERRGEKLAKEGHFSEAIDAFKQADRLVPRASHACLIALAYTRRELWPQAEIFFAVCRTLASSSDPAPDWLAAAEKTLAEHLASASVAPVEVRVEPAGVDARLAVSSFAHDETFPPRTIHLGFGDHVITASAEGYEPALQPVVIDSKAPKLVTIRLQRPRHPVVKPRWTPWIVMGAGAALVVAGGAYQLAVFQPARDRLARDVDPARLRPLDYAAASHDFDVKRDVTIALYAAGAVTAIAGYVLHETVLRDYRIFVTPTPGGATAGIAWP